MPDVFDDNALLRGCISGEDETAWETFVGKYSPLIWSSINKTFRSYSFVCSKQDTEDIFSSVFLSLVENDFRKLKQFRNENACTLSTFLSVVTIRMTIDFMRRDKRNLFVESVREGADVLDSVPHNGHGADIEVEGRERVAFFNKALNALPPRDRLIHDLLYNRCLSPEDVAGVLGVSVNTIYSRKNRMIEKMKKNVEAMQEKGNSRV